MLRIPTELKAVLFEVEPPELLKQLKEHLFASIGISIVLVALTVWVLSNSVPHHFLWGWASLQLTLAVARVHIVNLLARTDATQQSFVAFKLYYTALMLVIGVTWGGASVLASIYSPEITLVTIALIIAGLGGGAVSTLTPVFSGFVTFFFGSALTLSIAMFFSPYEVMVVMSPVVLLYTMIVFSSGYKLYNSVVDALKLTHDARQLNEVVVQQKEYAEQANRAKSTFLSSMSHELRTPLNAILGFSQLLKMDDLNPQQSQNLEEIHVAGEHLLSLINEVLDLSKVESGDVELNLQPVFIQESMQRCISMMKPLAEKRQITLVKLEEETHWCIEADVKRVQQVFLNLLSNAIKYNKHGGEVTIFCQQINDKFLRVSIKDTGFGIAKEKQEEVFSPFHRLGWEAGSVEGSGIGLFFTKKLMGLMHGQLGFESEQGVGSTFWCELPLVHVTADLSVPTKHD